MAPDTRWSGCLKPRVRGNGVEIGAMLGVGTHQTGEALLGLFAELSVGHVLKDGFVQI